MLPCRGCTNASSCTPWLRLRSTGCAHPACCPVPPLLCCPAGEDRPTSFKKMLANTCQEEYEATEEARKVRRRSAAECTTCDT